MPAYQECERCHADDGIERRVGPVEFVVLCLRSALEIQEVAA